MKTGTKVALGVGLMALGGGSALLWSRRTASETTRLRQECIGAAQQLLAFFGQNQGLDMTGTDQRQTIRVQQFQASWNRAQPVMGYRLPMIRSDGRWDVDTGKVFKQLTGYAPPEKRVASISGLGTGADNLRQIFGYNLAKG